jgi:choloylglycine hydrolase
MKMIIKFLTAAFFTGSILFEPLNACTGFKLQANDGSKVHGRTLEFAVDIDSSVAVVPRGYEFVGTTPEGPGLK